MVLSQPFKKQVFYLLISFFLLAAIAMAYGLQQLRHSLFHDRYAGVEDRVNAAFALVRNYQHLALVGDLTDIAAQEAAKETIRKMRFDDNEYLWLVDLSGNFLMHPTVPDLEGKNLIALKERGGEQLYEEVNSILQGSGRGFFDYQWTRVGASGLYDKMGYLRRFDTWGWGVAGAVYVDDIENIFWDEARNLLSVYGILLLVTITFWFGFGATLFPTAADSFNVSRN